jgi:hypothetical protein
MNSAVFFHFPSKMNAVIATITWQKKLSWKVSPYKSVVKMAVFWDVALCTLVDIDTICQGSLLSPS